MCEFIFDGNSNVSVTICKIFAVVCLILPLTFRLT